MYGPDLTPEVQTGLAWYYLLATLLNLGAAAYWTFWSRGKQMLTWEQALVAGLGTGYAILCAGWLFGLSPRALYVIATLANVLGMLAVLPASVYQKVTGGIAWALCALVFQLLGFVYAWGKGPEMPAGLRNFIDSLADAVTFFFGSVILLGAFLYFRWARVVRIAPIVAVGTPAAVVVFLTVSWLFHWTAIAFFASTFLAVAALYVVANIVGKETTLTGEKRLKTWDIAVPFGFTDPPVMWGILNGILLFFGFAMTDYDFRLIVAKPDNVPITIMLFTVGYFTWLFLRKAVINDQRLAQGLKPLEAEESEKVLVWPDLVYTELIAMIVCTIVLVLWSILLQAPLEEWSNLTKTPNPSKAPWYFLGLQEMLVYYDPWAAGVVFPSLIIFGLMAIPFIDFNQQGAGYFTFVQRSFSVALFMFGFIVLWVLMVMLGTFLRGPGWNFFGPFKYWDPHMVLPLNNVDLSDYFWVHWLGRGKPEHWYVREIPGFVVVLGYFMVMPPLLAKTMFRQFFVRMGFARYMVFILLFLSMAALPIKMLLRWSFNLKYIIHIDEFFFNI